eukprot:CAMPEP_0194359796 /NCGR_PEP_ID=MMETSP0174-20130528/7086_1 /TAXON_ID=216777 /ORGANISM="Proboscia alata, Strain PI-D3" /LENGTH=241 /DNA_ID=CAMNT_0039130911 /DNA_START=98 /DNA_END=823 /DNA_ORIENTATION=-
MIRSYTSFLLLVCITPLAAFVIQPHTTPTTTLAPKSTRLYSEPPSPDEPESDEKSDGRYDVTKLTGGADDGAGFNQFDPVLTATTFLSRRFGIVGGLAIFATFLFVEGDEIVKALGDKSPLEGDGVVVSKPSGLSYTESLIGRSGNVPLAGSVIGLRAKVSIGDTTIYDTKDDKPVAFKLGQRPFQNIVCAGVEEGIVGMKVGGKRRLEVPKDLAPPGLVLPEGVNLVYDIELTEVLAGYF